jgi:hypothetical protein
MLQKQNGLAMDDKNLSEIYIVEIKMVIPSWAAGVMKKKGVKNALRLL